jgi:hypothetical protein
MITATDLDVSASRNCDIEVCERVHETGNLNIPNRVRRSAIVTKRTLLAADSEEVNHCGNLQNKLECRTVAGAKQ